MAINNLDLLKSSTVIKISTFILIAVASFYFGNEWFQSDRYQRLRYLPNSEFEWINPNLNGGVSNNLDINASSSSSSSSFHPLQDEEREEAFFDTVYAPPPLPMEARMIKRMGVLDENGVMMDDFEIGDFDPNMVEIFEKVNVERNPIEKVRVKKFRMCPRTTTDYIPCLADKKSIDKLNSTNKWEVFERHCPEAGRGLNCLIPAPKGYKKRIPWPNSRGEVWLRNVPHTRLLVGKGGQNWITISKDKVKFSGGGVQFIHDADQYLDHIEKMVPEIAFGNLTRVVLDVGSGVASFGAYLFSRNVLTLSINPNGVHENQIQLALERGVPGMVVAFARRRLPYPSQAFDMIHCSECRINWTQDDGVLLLEADRILRAGGYFIWAAEPIYNHELLLEARWKEMLNLTDRLCWNLVKKEGYISVWKKPLSNSCYLSRKEGTHPPLCKPDDDPDKVWYVDLKPCITRLPEKGLGSNVTIWPARLLSPPDRLESIHHDAYICRKELFKADTKFWDEIVEGYIRVLRWKSDKFRNVLDMKAGFGGFAAALINNDMDFWVLNVVPVSSPNTLSVIYDRGLFGVMHDWCEPFDTYPRTYDLIHAAGLFSIERKRCNISTIMLDMDRILRPGGDVYIRDSITVVDEIKATGNAIGWHVTVRDTAEGPHSSFRFLVCNKRI